MPAPAPPMIVALVTAQGQSREMVTENMVAFIRRLVAGMQGKWYDDAAVKEFGRQADAMVRQAQSIVGDMTGAYMDGVFEEMRIAVPAGVIALPERLRDVPAEVEWERPAKVYRYQKFAGADDLAAQEQAVLRASMLAEMDVALAARHASSQRMQAAARHSRVTVGYRRVTHPEIAEFGSCGLCVSASDRTYHVKELMPIHERCHCTVLPTRGDDDPGLALNDADLGGIYDAAGSTGRDDLKRVRVSVQDNGELGPVLVRHGDNFRTAADAARLAR